MTYLNGDGNENIGGLNDGSVYVVDRSGGLSAFSADGAAKNKL